MAASLWLADITVISAISQKAVQVHMNFIFTFTTTYPQTVDLNTCNGTLL